MIALNHTIVPSKDKVAASQFFAEIFGLKVEITTNHFAPVKINDTLTLDWDNRDEFDSHHYAFHVSDEEFDAILGRVKAKGLAYGSGPNSHTDGQISSRHGRGFYFGDPDGHLLELMTHP